MKKIKAKVDKKMSRTEINRSLGIKKKYINNK